MSLPNQSVLCSSAYRIALAAIERTPKPVLAPLRRRHPAALDPRRVMSHMLGVTTRQVCHPISPLILVKGNDRTLHTPSSIDVCAATSKFSYCYYNDCRFLATSNYMANSCALLQAGHNTAVLHQTFTGSPAAPLSPLPSALKRSHLPTFRGSVLAPFA
jgi:hypothetical protein